MSRCSPAGPRAPARQPGHGIPELAADGLAEAMNGFFALPFEEKNTYKPSTPETNWGYTAPRGERLSYSLGLSSPADLFEAYNAGAEASRFPGLDLPEEHYPANMWPDRPALFERNVEEWMHHAGRLATTLTRVFAVALDLPPDYF